MLDGGCWRHMQDGQGGMITYITIRTVQYRTVRSTFTSQSEPCLGKRFLISQHDEVSRAATMIQSARRCGEDCVCSVWNNTQEKVIHARGSPLTVKRIYFGRGIIFQGVRPCSRPTYPQIQSTTTEMTLENRTG